MKGDEKIKEYFPNTIAITQELLAKANNRDANMCIGALALKSFLPQELHEFVIWGSSIGRIKGVALKTEIENDKGEKLPHYIMEITSPRAITFQLRQIQKSQP